MPPKALKVRIFLNYEDYQVSDHITGRSADVLLTEAEAAEFLQVSPRTLQGWRYNGGGPRFVRISRRIIRYRRQDLLDWIEKRTVASTSAKI